MKFKKVWGVFLYFAESIEKIAIYESKKDAKTKCLELIKDKYDSFLMKIEVPE